MSLPAACALLPCPYLVACCAGWQPLEAGMAGQDSAAWSDVCKRPSARWLQTPWCKGFWKPGRQLCLLQGTPALVSAAAPCAAAHGAIAAGLEQGALLRC